MRRISLPVAVVCLLVLSCGSSLKVQSDYDRQLDFNVYQTFAVYKNDSSSTAVSALNRNRIQRAVITEMAKKGFKQVVSGADLLVNIVAVVKSKVSVSSNTSYYGYGGIYRPYYWGEGSIYGTTTYDVQQYKEGSLLIDMVDARTQKIVWHGSGNSKIDAPLPDPEVQIPRAVAKIMAGFPPGNTH